MPGLISEEHSSAGDQYGRFLSDSLKRAPAWVAGDHTRDDVVSYAGGLWAAASSFTDAFFDIAQWNPISPIPYVRPSAKLPSQPQMSAVVTTFAPGHGFVAANTSSNNLNDTTDFAMGSQCATVRSQGTGTGCRVSNTAVASFDTTGKQLVIVGKIDNPQHLVASGSRIQVSLGNDAAFANFWKFVPAAGQTDFLGGPGGDWIRITLNWADAVVGAGAPTRTGIVAVQIQFTDDNTANPVTAHWNLVGTTPEPSTLFPNGVVSVTFDDSWENTWQNAKPILDLAGIPCTKYILQSPIVNGGTDRLNLTQLQREQDLGLVELAGHAGTIQMHDSNGGYTDFTAGQIYADLAQHKQWMVQNGFRGCDHFAYPRGVQNAALVSIAREFFASARTTCQYTMETVPPADPMRLRAVSGISSFAGGKTAAAVNTLIDNAKANHAWLILVFHEITTLAPTTTTQCLTSDFQTIISHIQSSGIQALPVGEVLKVAT